MEKRIEILERKLELVIDALIRSANTKHGLEDFKPAVWEMQRELIDLHMEHLDEE